MEISSQNESVIEDLKERIADLKKRMPKHSVPPAMIIELEDLEEALDEAISALVTDGK